MCKPIGDDRIGGCRMQTLLLEILREIPDHRLAMGRRSYLATVLLYAQMRALSTFYAIFRGLERHRDISLIF